MRWVEAVLGGRERVQAGADHDRATTQDHSRAARGLNERPTEWFGNAGSDYRCRRARMTWSNGSCSWATVRPGAEPSGRGGLPRRAGGRRQGGAPGLGRGRLPVRQPGALRLRPESGRAHDARHLRAAERRRAAGCAAAGRAGRTATTRRRSASTCWPPGGRGGLQRDRPAHRPRPLARGNRRTGHARRLPRASVAARRHQVALTCVHATAERMEMAGVPTLRIRPTGAAIRGAADLGAARRAPPAGGVPARRGPGRRARRCARRRAGSPRATGARS